MINHMSLFEAIAASPSVKTLGTCTTDSWSFFFPTKSFGNLDSNSRLLADTQSVVCLWE